MPDLDQELARHGGDGDIAAAFAGKEFPAPLAQRGGPAHAQNGLRALDEEVAKVAAASLADADFDVLAGAAFALARIEADIGEFPGRSKRARRR